MSIRLLGSACEGRPLHRRVGARLAGLTAVAALLLFGAGCSLAPASKMPAPATALPGQYEAPTRDSVARDSVSSSRLQGEAVTPDTAGVYAPQRWWRTYGDPALDRLVDSTLAANLDLVEAAARVRELQARYRIERAALLPGVQADADVTYQSQTARDLTFGGAPTGSGAPTGGPMGGGGSDGAAGGDDRIDFTIYSASLGVSYEVDLWGRVRNDTRAALLDYLATEADLQAVRLGVLSETIATYFDIYDLRQRILLTLETVDLLAERVEVTEDRYARGLVTSFELYTIRQNYRDAQARLPQLESALTAAEGRLAVLLGQPAGTIASVLGDTLQPVLGFDPVPAGLPSDLLLQRPDVRAEARRYEAARHRVGARRAELLPTLSLSGAVGSRGEDLSQVLGLDRWFANLVGGLAAPLFQGGRLRANVDAAEARYAQQAAVYARTVLTAYQEVQAALERLEEEQQRYAFLLDQQDEARASADLQASRYEQGLADYLDYLDALRNLLAVQTTLTTAGREVALARLDVHRALGGGWIDAGERPEPTLRTVPQAVPTGRD